MEITVQYSCTLCGIQDAAVQVPARMSNEESVGHWVEQIMGHALKADHLRRSPHCPAKSLRDVKIPVTNAERLGGPGIQ